MSEQLMNETRWKLAEALDSAITDESIAAATKKFKSACDELQDEMEYRLKSDLSYNLSSWVKQMAEKAIEAMLNGDEETMRRYLSCKEGYWTGRDRDHPVIHGEFFEQGCILLRKRIVDAHAELLKNECILDLEDQVRSLVDQVNKISREKDEMWERLRS